MRPSSRKRRISASMSLALDRGYEPPRNSEVIDSHSARPAPADDREACFVERVTRSTALVRDHAGLKKMRL
jgi:hypothetical protein